MNELPPVRLKAPFILFSASPTTAACTCSVSPSENVFRGLRSGHDTAGRTGAANERALPQHHIQGEKSPKEKRRELQARTSRRSSPFPIHSPTKENRERFICNMVTGGIMGGDTCKARKDMANILISLRRNIIFCISPDMADMTTWKHCWMKWRKEIHHNNKRMPLPVSSLP